MDRPAASGTAARALRPFHLPTASFDRPPRLHHQGDHLRRHPVPAFGASRHRPVARLDRRAGFHEMQSEQPHLVGGDRGGN